jgi:hypothetical protein
MPLEYIWFWQPRADNPHCRYGEPGGLVVGKIISAATKTDINIEVTHSVHPRFPVGSKCRRCRMKTRDIIMVDGVPTDRQTKKEIMPSEPAGKEVASEGNEDASFNPNKYSVYKTRDLDNQTADEVRNAFVLLPEKDPAALQALRSYAALCKSPSYQKELVEWIKRIEREIVPQWQKGEHLGSMGRINAGIDKLV